MFCVGCDAIVGTATTVTTTTAASSANKNAIAEEHEYDHEHERLTPSKRHSSPFPTIDAAHDSKKVRVEPRTRANTAADSSEDIAVRMRAGSNTQSQQSGVLSHSPFMRSPVSFARQFSSDGHASGDSEQSSTISSPARSRSTSVDAADSDTVDPRLRSYAQLGGVRGRFGSAATAPHSRAPSLAMPPTAAVGAHMQPHTSAAAFTAAAQLAFSTGTGSRGRIGSRAPLKRTTGESPQSASSPVTSTITPPATPLITNTYSKSRHPSLSLGHSAHMHTFAGSKGSLFTPTAASAEQQQQQQSSELQFPLAFVSTGSSAAATPLQLPQTSQSRQRSLSTDEQLRATDPSLLIAAVQSTLLSKLEQCHQLLQQTTDLAQVRELSTTIKEIAAAYRATRSDE